MTTIQWIYRKLKDARRLRQKLRLLKILFRLIGVELKCILYTGYTSEELGL